MDLRTALGRVVNGEHLSEGEMEAVMRNVMNGEATPAQIGAFLVALRMKGEQVGEITGAARAMRRHALRVTTHRDVVDTCGTGGDARGTFNISTTAALIAAAAGVVVAKHGNRAMSGAVGGADVLEALGVRIDLDADRVAGCLEEVGIGFLFAQVFHPAMRHVAGPRREIGLRTIFNLLGPLSNPAGAQAQLLGVFSDRWVEPLADALARLGSRRAMVVHGEDGLDEITLTGTTIVAELRDDNIHTHRLDPTSFGLSLCTPVELQGGDVAANAGLIRSILEGTSTEAQRDISLLNAAAAIYVGGLATTLESALERARDALRSGGAAQKLTELIEYTNR
jgi:anthranilate phosphoribosyltransferase